MTSLDSFLKQVGALTRNIDVLKKTSKRYNFFPSEMSSGYQWSCEELLCVQSSFHTSELR
jgi:hypothetical protein